MMVVYILYLSDGTYYTGITNNLKRRLTEHRKGYSRSTRRKLPVLDYWFHVVVNRKMARRIEVIIKNTGAKKYLNRHNIFENGSYSS